MSTSTELLRPADTAKTTDAAPLAGAAASAQGHRHAWRTRSRHNTSEGEVLWVQCAHCGAFRAELRPRTPWVPPEERRAGAPTEAEILTRELGAGVTAGPPLEAGRPEAR